MSNIYKQIYDRLTTNQIIENASYYSLFLGSDQNEKLIIETQTNWSGWEEVNGKKIEIREPAQINPKAYINLMKDVNWEIAIINNLEEIKYYLLLGGHAILAEELFEKYFRKFFENEPCSFTLFNGFSSIKNIDEATQKNPKAKLRMKIFNRDNRRCQICGRSPHDYIDLELHIHHIFPWSMGGLTIEENLITLCKVCHTGLEPHYDFSLHNIISKELTEEDKIKLYRRNIGRNMSNQHGT
jgi:hypothetical protein